MEKKMAVRMERPVQEKEEWEEEPESVKTGNILAGPRVALRRGSELFSMKGETPLVYHDIDLEKADQHRSGTRTDISDQDKEELKVEPESGRAGDSRTGQRSASRTPRAFRSLVPPLLEETLSTEANDADSDTADQHRSKRRRTESSVWGGGLFFRMIIPSWMRRRWPTAHRKDDCDSPDQPKTSQSKTKRRKAVPEYACNVFGTRSAAAVWIMTALAVATSSLAGAECIGTEVELDKGEAVLRCPLPVDANDTRQGIIIKHFPTPDSADEVLYCDWPTEDADKPKCQSSHGFSLEGQLTDQVVAKVPVARLMDSGAYKCQLFPFGVHKYFNPCHIHRFSDNDEGSAVVPTPVDSSNGTDRRTPDQDPLIREAPPCEGHSSSVGVTAAVLVLQFITIILLVVSGLYLQNPKNLQGKDGCLKDGWMAWRPWNSSERSTEMPEADRMNRQTV